MMVRIDPIKSIFLIISAMLIVMPALFTDFRKSVASDIDNRNLAEISTTDNRITDSIDKYLEDRVGFRKQAINLYQTVCNTVFHKLTMPNYRYGKNNDIYSEIDLATYQHRDTPQEYPENYAGFIKSIQDYSEKRGCRFLYYLIPNKETIYFENFPEGYNIKDQKNRTELILDELGEKEVNYYCSISEFREDKSDALLYNKKYDVLHWNDRGCFKGMQGLINELNRTYPGIEGLKDDEVKKSEIIQERFVNSNMIINEVVPKYEIDSEAVNDTEDYFKNIKLVDDKVYYFHYSNPKNITAPRMLVFGDSYFGFFSLVHESLANRTSDLTIIHTNNITRADYYISEIKPDIVLVEAVERVLTADNGQWSMDVVKNRF